MNFLDKALYEIAPVHLEKRMEAKENIHKRQMNMKFYDAGGQVADLLTTDKEEVVNSGYSHSGASKRRKWAKGYRSKSGSAKEDIEKNRKLLRERSRDLSMNSPMGAAATGTVRTNCVGQGLIPKPKIDYEYLGISKEEARDLEKQIRNEFALWAESTLCDNNDQNNFYELQQIAFMDWMRNGEEFVLIKYKDEELPYMPYQLRLKLVEADRISTPGSLDGDYDGVDEVKKNGNKIVNGVEISKSGTVEAYHISSRFPDEDSFGEVMKWKRVKKRGEKTGNPNILHVFNAERAEQYRGVPFLAPVIESVKQLSRYTEAEIMAAVINSMFAIFITTQNADGVEGFGGEDEEGEEQDRLPGEKDDELEVGAGSVHFLKTGEGVQAVSVSHPSQNFDGFSKAMAKYIGAALEIAPEVLLKEFRNNFSASKGAMNESWRAFKMRRKWFVDDFCQEVYMLWFSEAVSKGRIRAPGFFNNPMIRKAYTKCRWNGPTQGQIDPGKEVTAAANRVKEGFTTREDECAAMNGSDYEDNVRTLEYENQMLRMANGEERKETGGDNE